MNYTGKLSDGKRVYVRPGKNDRHPETGAKPLAFAVFAEIERTFPTGTRMELVARVSEGMHTPERVWNGKGSWLPREEGRELTAREMAEEHATWWRNLGRRADRERRVEIVELKPVGGKAP